MSDTPRPRGFDEEDLAAAVAAGVLPAASAEAFVTFVEGRRVAAPRADEEEVRFVTSFNDIFVTLGILLLAGGLAFVVGRGRPGLAAAAVALLAWGLSELFSRRWRMAFPSIALTALLVGAAGVAGTFAGDVAGMKNLAAIVGAATAFAVGWVHWRRFGVPISVAAATAGAGIMVLALLQAVAPGFFDAHRDAVLLPLGLVVFALAMWWDASDRERRTRRTDVAFWLHLLASPLIVHPAISIAGIDLDSIGVGEAGFVLALFVVIAFVALVVDRRALLVSGLLYLGVSIGVLIERSGWTPSVGAPLTVGVVGAVILVIAVGWRPLRAAALRLAPASVRALVPLPASPQGSRS
ncbi:MAG: hypothetical protein OEL76_05935 [Siculibacillus sp.]|nr:hypothetical protein [Siculibacillus sp.]